jgi:predicted alpha-1,6-mannanase (GH76 family)
MATTTLVSGLAAGAMLLTPDIELRDARMTYKAHSTTAIIALQNTWYNSRDGLWQDYWWNSANCLTTLANFAGEARKEAEALNLISGVFQSTFTNAQRSVASTIVKTVAQLDVPPLFHNPLQAATKRAKLSTQGFGGFLNDYYDDEGWWALGLIAAYDVNKDARFLSMVRTVIYRDMKAGYDTSTCRGGLWWRKERDIKNAIPNELFIAVAASLANRVPVSQKQQYLDVAKTAWAWFKRIGLINSQSLINDGLSGCTNNRAQTWSYNQGVILGALVEMYKATGNSSYIDEAHTLAAASIKALTDSNGVLQEMPCGGLVCAQFKGIYVRNLGYLHGASPKQIYADTIINSANSIWSTARNTANNHLGYSWTGPVSAGGGPDATTHCSALDALVTAMLIS